MNEPSDVTASFRTPYAEKVDVPEVRVTIATPDVAGVPASGGKDSTAAIAKAVMQALG